MSNPWIKWKKMWGVSRIYEDQSQMAPEFDCFVELFLSGKKLIWDFLFDGYDEEYGIILQYLPQKVC